MQDEVFIDSMQMLKSINFLYCVKLKKIAMKGEGKGKKGPVSGWLNHEIFRFLFRI